MAGDGSLFQRTSDGLWVAQISVGPRGSRKVIRRYRKRRQDAKAELDKLRATAGRVDQRTTVGTYLRAWIDGPGRDVLKASTWETYELSVRLHLAPALGHHPLGGLEPEHVEAMATDLRRRMTAKGVRNVLSILSRILAVAERRRQIMANPVRFVEAPRGPKPKRPQAMTRDQGRAVLDAVAGDRLEALYVVTLACGLRQAEVLGLQWSDVDLERGSLRIARSLARVDGRYVLTSTKTDNVATLALPRFAAEALRTHRARQLAERLTAGVPTEDGLVFVTPAGRPINGGWLSHRWRTLSRAAGFDLRFHDLRHGHTSLLIAANVHPKIIQARDRHANVAMTLDQYGHVTSDQDVAAAALLDEEIG